MTITAQSPFLAAARGERTRFTPVWLMRQAGRYLPQYRKLREGTDFLAFCKNPEKSAEATVQPIEYLGADAAILFADILLIADAMGLELEYQETKGPVIHNPLRTEDDLKRLKPVDAARDLGYVMETIQLTQAKLAALSGGPVPLIGFAGAPFTTLSYMVEGGHSKTHATVKTIMLDQPKLFAAMMERVTDVTRDYLRAQIAAGVQAIQLFDTWLDVLPPSQWNDHVAPHLLRLWKELTADTAARGVARIYFGKGVGRVLDTVAKMEIDVAGIDWTTDLAAARATLPRRLALQGNLDPITLYSSETTIEREVRKLLYSLPDLRGYIFNLGHGMMPDMDPVKTKFLVDTVHRLSAEKLR